MVGRPDAVGSVEDGYVVGGVEFHIRDLVADDVGQAAAPNTEHNTGAVTPLEGAGPRTYVVKDLAS